MPEKGETGGNCDPLLENEAAKGHSDAQGTGHVTQNKPPSLLQPTATAGTCVMGRRGRESPARDHQAYHPLCRCAMKSHEARDSRSGSRESLGKSEAWKGRT